LLVGTETAPLVITRSQYR